jgi:fructuronate reductase
VIFDRFKRLFRKRQVETDDPYANRLTEDNIATFPPLFDSFDYQRKRQLPGMVHFGIGAFHRAHQAVYVDKAMSAGERHWAIIGVSLRSRDVASQINPQDGLYTVAERSGDKTSYRLVGAVQQVLYAGWEWEAESIIEAIAYPTVHVITFTVTEKGYCRGGEGELDLGLAGETSIYRFLKDGLSLRRALGLPGLTLLSCDNLAGNGHQLSRLLNQYLKIYDPVLADWVDAECTFPNSMVDRIVPATTPADLVAAQDAMGWGDLLWDEAHVVTEPFSQWVIEDKFAGPRPRWEDHGAEIVSDVAPYETAKLRMLNGAHSALAYLGLQRGHEFVHQAIGDAALAPQIDRLMRQEAAISLTPAPGQDLSAYADALIERFKNPALNHRLVQIAMDGSQKIPQRWLETLAHHQERGEHCPAILAGIAAWLCHIRGDNGPVDDPMDARLKATWDAAGKDGILATLFGPGGPMASDWVPSDADRNLILSILN